MFFQEHHDRLEAFARLSQTAGSQAAFVQGGGGNTSVKLSGGRMAIKASGFCLGDIRPDRAYAVLDYPHIQAFYYENQPENFPDVEAAGAQRTKESTLHIEGLDALRPSVEAGFHAILDTFVLHTHSVYANLAACSTACRDIAGAALDGADYTWGWVPYTDPGANLTFAIRDELKRVEAATGRRPAVILMQNHGIIVHAEDDATCLAIHTDANTRLARHFGLTLDAFPEIRLTESADGLWEGATPYLSARLKHCAYTQQQLLEEPLYPDQMVFLTDTFFLDADTVEDGQAVADTATGTLRMRMPRAKAQTLVETLTAIFFIMEHIRDAGLTLSTMGEAAKRFIANWESEKYRKALSGKKV